MKQLSKIHAVKTTIFYAMFAGLLGIASCASVSNLPSTAAEANWDSAIGDTGWAKYEDQLSITDATSGDIVSAARAALMQNSFSVRRMDEGAGVVIGERGMTAQDWNTLAAFYFRESTSGDGWYDVRILIEGSKDLGFEGDTMETDYLGLLTNAFLLGLPTPEASEATSVSNPDECLATAKTLIDNGMTTEATKLLETCVSD